MEDFDVVIVGAGAAGMMCAIEAGKRGRRVLIVDHAEAPGEKIRISGGGRCNFTNTDTTPKAFLSQNPKFCISALRRYRPTDFIALVEEHGIAWHEKTLGQLFCDDSAKQIVAMLLEEMREAGVTLRLGVSVEDYAKADDGYRLTIGGRAVKSAALVPLTFEVGMLEKLKPLAGVALDASISANGTHFDEAMLFTHRGLSGPAVLQISSYWREGDEIEVDMAPGQDIFDRLRQARSQSGRQSIQTALSHILPRSLALHICETEDVSGNIADLNDKALKRVATAVNAWKVKPVGSEGYRTAEVTLGGVDTHALDGRTMEVKAVPGLYFIGEVVDVTGWLGGYNFQWAWASGWCAGQAV